MDKYSVMLMNRAVRDLDGIYDYIAKTLSEPVTALKLVDRIEDAIMSLEHMPYRCSERKLELTVGVDTVSSLLRTILLSFVLMKQKNLL